jgi:hypothetical protein
MPDYNKLLIGDTEYELSEAYIHGAKAFRANTPNNCNPHRYRSAIHDAWDYGHCNESAGEHFRFGQDVLVAARKGLRFEMDNAVPRVDGADPDYAWVCTQRKSFKATAGYV